MDDTPFPNLGTGAISAALEGKVDFQIGGKLVDKNIRLLTHLNKPHYKDILSSCCFIDLTVYDYRKENLLLFKVIAPSEEKANLYKRNIDDYLKPKPTSQNGDQESFSIAANPQFRREDSMYLVSLLPVSDPNATPSIQYDYSNSMFAEIEYSSPEYGHKKFKFPDLQRSLAEFQRFLTANQRKFTDPIGRALVTVVCVNYLLPALSDDAELRPFGQLFLGVSSAVTNGHNTGIREEYRRFLSDLAILLYRNCAGQRAWKEGFADTEESFAHRNGPIMGLLWDWPRQMSDYFEITNSDSLGFSATLIKEHQDYLKPENIGIIPLVQWYKRVLNHVRSWTLPTHHNNLPLINGVVPKNIKALIDVCFDAGWEIYAFTLFDSATNRDYPLEFRTLAHIYSHFESLRPVIHYAGSAQDHALDLKERVRGLDYSLLSRVIIMTFQEAIQHGDWSKPVGVELEYVNGGVLAISISNGRIQTSSMKNPFTSIGNISAESFFAARLSLHRGYPNRQGGEGREEIERMAFAAGSKGCSISKPNSSDPTWTVRFEFPLY